MEEGDGRVRGSCWARADRIEGRGILTGSWTLGEACPWIRQPLAIQTVTALLPARRARTEIGAAYRRPQAGDAGSASLPLTLGSSSWVGPACLPA